MKIHISKKKKTCVSPVVDLALLHPDSRVMGGAVGGRLVARVNLGVLIQLGIYRFINLNINISSRTLTYLKPRLSCKSLSV